MLFPSHSAGYRAPGRDSVRAARWLRSVPAALGRDGSGDSGRDEHRRTVPPRADEDRQPRRGEVRRGHPADRDRAGLTHKQ
jgi:hypothetical protein